MAEDIVPGLIEKLQKDFKTRYDGSKTIQKSLARIEAGKGTYADAYRYAVEVGNIRAKTFKGISSAMLPDGKMYYNIAQRVCNDTLGKDYELVTDYTKKIQTKLNQNNKLGIKAQKPSIDKDRIDGFVQRLANGELYDDISWILDEPVRVFTQSAVDATIQKNAEFQDDTGVSVTITRTSDGGCCAWCDALEGEYEAPFPSEIFARHDNCRCTLEYKGHRMNSSGHAFTR